jgi:hypothetical protein
MIIDPLENEAMFLTSARRINIAPVYEYCLSQDVLEPANAAPPFDAMVFELAGVGSVVAEIMVWARPARQWAEENEDAMPDLLEEALSARWVLCFKASSVSLRGVDGHAVSSIERIVVGAIVDETGRVLSRLVCGDSAGLKSAEEAVTASETSPQLMFVQFAADVVLFAIGLMHCKNVALAERAQSGKLLRSRRRRGLPPPPKIYDLKIRPTGGSRASLVGLSDIKQALHIARGHFKTYSVDRPLFGRIAGTFWWSPVLRGSVEHGTVVKDYVVDRPATGKDNLGGTSSHE